MADPVQSQVFQTNIPQQLLPYQENLLKQAEAFTNIAKYPYQQYQGEQVAQFAPLQQQAFGAAGQLQVPGQVGAGTNLAQAAGLSALGTQYDPTSYQASSFTQPYMASQYMSPYMQDVVRTQQQEAIRQANIANTALGAQATRAGAFGGSRQAIEQAQANRNLQTQLGNIQATGLQNAYQQAMQQFNTEQQARQQAAQMREQSRQFGAGLGMQGLQTGLQAASTLGTLGQQQSQEQLQNIGLQAQLGQTQQQRAQDVLNAQYQNFLNYQNYPYKQMGFMSDIIRGTPLTQTGSSIYQAPPTAMQNMMSLGLGAYGLNQLGIGKAEGGEVKSYARGGISDSVMSPEFKRYAVDHIDPRQLPLAQRNAVMRGDRETADFVTDEMLVDAAIRRGAGLAAAFTPQMADNVIRAAGGGILAFAEGGSNKAPTTMQQAIESLYSTELPELDRGSKYVESVRGIRSGLEGLYPASEAIPIYQQMIQKQQARLPEIQQQMRGLTALRMAAALQKAGVTSGDRYAGMFEAAASGAEKAQSLTDAANNEMMKSSLLMAQAKDSRAMGMTDKAISEKSASEAHAQRAAQFKREADKQLVQTLGTKEIHEGDRASRERIAEKQIAAANRPGESERKIADYEARIGRKLTADEYLDVMGQVGAATYGVRHTGQKGDFEHKAKVDELIQKDKRFEHISLDLMRAGGKKDAKSTALRDDANARLAELRKEYEDRYKMTPTATGGAKIPPPQAIDALKGNPALRDQFDRYYGPGSSAKYLGE